MVYFADEHPKSGLAQLSTLYRFARFFGAYEILYTDFGFLNYQDDEKTRKVDRLLAQIAKTFARDKYDFRVPDDPNSSRFMLWREVQRGIGELSIDRSNVGEPRTIGIAAFNEQYQDRYSILFQDLLADLKDEEPVKESVRLARVQQWLRDLVVELDEEQRYATEEKRYATSRPRWMSQSKLKFDWD